MNEEFELTNRLLSVNSPLNKRTSITPIEYDEFTSDMVPSTLMNAKNSFYKQSGLYAQEIVSTDSVARNPIQKAIDKVSNAGGGQVIMLPGNYLVTETITLRDKVSLLGYDPTTTFINFGGGTNNLQTASDARNVNIRNLYLYNCQNGSACVYYDAPLTCEITNCIFYANTNSGTVPTASIFIDTAYLVKLENIYCITSDAVLKFSDSTNVRVSNVFGTGLEYGVIGDDSSVLGAQVSSFDSLNLETTKHAINGVFNACSFTNSYVKNVGTTAGTTVALSGNNSDSNSFTGNRIETKVSGGLPLSLDNQADFNKFIGNIVDAFTYNQSAMYINTTQNTFSSNRIVGHGTNNFAVNLGTSSTKNVLTGNILVNSGGAGTVLDNGSNNLLASNITSTT